jgi:hypothetical protein
MFTRRNQSRVRQTVQRVQLPAIKSADSQT